MFVSHAHSFRQQARLAVTLAWVAGYTNIITVLACGTVTSHTSGTTSTLGREIFSGSWGVAGFAAFLLISFCLGAALSGFCTELGRRRGWESIFVLPMVIEASLLAVFAVFLELAGAQATASLSEFAMTGLASAAMGLQNATITQISSGQVRTTHVTGVLTDIGHDLVQFIWWRSDQRRNASSGRAASIASNSLHHPSGRRVILLTAIFGVFALGAGLGTVAFTHLPRFAMFPPVIFLLWIIYQDISTPIAEIESATLAVSGLELPASMAVFHLRKDHDRQGRVHRIPNLLTWSERLPPHARVVILDMIEVTELNSNAILEFKTLLERLGASRRILILAGMTPERWSHFHGVSGAPLPLESVCPDLDLAIARGLNYLADEISGERALDA